jgi:hypothetical protein
VLILIVIGYIAYMVSDKDKSSSRTSATPQARKPAPARSPPPSKRPDDFDSSPEKHAARKAFIDKLQAQGLWGDLRLSNNVGKVWVTNAFLLLDEKTQNQFLNVAYCWFMGEDESFGCGDLFCDPVIIKVDNATPLGRDVGEYEPMKGIRLK